MATIKGIWMLNAAQTAIESADSLTQEVGYTSNGIVFDRMLLLGDYQSAMTYSNQEDSYSVYTHSGGWVNEAFRTVDFGETEQTVSDEWFVAFTRNATLSGDEILAIKKSTLTGIADAVRSKTGKTAEILGSEIEDEIRSITAGKVLPKFDGTVVIE